MRLLFDENFPLALYHRLRRQGLDVEHIVASGQRGLPDSAIIGRLRQEPDLVFLTQDLDFWSVEGLAARVIVSRVRQSRKIAERVELWVTVLERLFSAPPPERFFELLDDGTLVPFQEFPGGD
jgi:hypothetical protein